MIVEKLKEAIAKAAGINAADVQLEHPTDLSHGDYSTSIAFRLAKERGKKALELTLELIQELQKGKLTEVARIEAAGPGFINFHLSRDFFAEYISKITKGGETWGRNERLSGKRVMVEYTDPNPFKEFHIGHLMSNTIGEAISRVIEFSGAEVHRANYQGDVGLHVAQAILGKQQKPGLSWGEAYAYGATHYESNKHEIDALNKALYERSDEKVNALYDSGRKTSLAGFETIYKMLGTKFDHYFFESEVAPIGRALVAEHKEIFDESDGAVIFRAEKFNPALHTRVFVTSQGIPTYEAKELGLAPVKFEAWPHDRSVVITAAEITDYYRVVLEALQKIEPDLAKKITHVPHGFLRLPSGKMSSRTGDVITAVSLIEELTGKALERMEHKDKKIAEQVAVAAIKYAVLKQAAGRDIIFDIEKSLSFEGDSGPYLQYAHARARSVLEKAKRADLAASIDMMPQTVSALERMLYRFPEVVERALEEYAPHHITTFLTEIAGAFNGWYANERIVDESSEAPYRVALTEAFATTMENGLWLLGIQALPRM
ncbi:MAG TPA: arginine--tRNA ligase [Candidatus Paceibacterota bacterium]|jgi:arginyl-tRNA synthetase